MMYALIRSFAIFFCFASFLTGRGQEVVRLELEASDLSLPFYTIPVAKQGVIVFRSTQTSAKRASGWELYHYDTRLKPVEKMKLDIPVRYAFAGWEVNDSFLVLLFLAEPPGINGRVEIYHISEKTKRSVQVEVPDIRVNDLFFFLSGSRYLLGGMLSDRNSGGLFSRDKKRNDLVENLFLVSGNCHQDTIAYTRFAIPGITEIAHVQPLTDASGLLLAARVSALRYLVSMDIWKIYFESKPAFRHLHTIPPSEKYLVGVSFSGEDDDLVITGTYGTRTKKSWKDNTPVLAEGVCYLKADTLKEVLRYYYPFSGFRRMPEELMKQYFQNASGNRKTKGERGNMSYRMLLHGNPYKYNDQNLLVAEAYFPEYEYENRTQFYSTPYSYYGSYYPGFYDSGSRWVFKGFRYEYAIVAAFDSVGAMKWENGFEISNILDKNLNTRLTVMPFKDEVLLVYAFDGKIWYRVISESNVIVDKESIPVELPSPSERIRENFSMNLSQWYESYFLVWGRQTVTNNDGRSRTVYYCNKLLFE